MTERVPEYVFHQFENLFDTMDGAYFGEAEISGILNGAKRDGIYPGADYVYRYIQCLQIRLREEKEKVLHQKRKRCLLYAKNHKNLGDLATDTIRLIGLNAYAFTKETETACVAYWNRIRDCHYRRHDEWLELAEKFKDKETR